MLTYILGLLAGMAQPTQTSCNGKTCERLDSVYITTYVTTGTAIITLLIILLITEGTIYLPLARIAQEPLWIWCGGLCGTVIILTSITCLPKLGSAVTVLLTAFGQVMIGLIIDNWGLFHTNRIPMDPVRLIAAVLVLLGVVLVSREKPFASARGALGGNDGEAFGEAKTGEGTSENGETDENKIPYYFLGVTCGIACGLQVAINGSLGVVAGAPMRATLISMCFAIIGITIVCAFVLITKGRNGLYASGEPGKFRLKWWMLSGGLFGTFIVGINAIIAPILGSGICNILNLVGETGVGIFYDSIGFLGLEKKRVTLIKLIGVFLMIVGTVIISLL